MSISVLIATYNRATMLSRCLTQLARQAYETGDEVIVVDNGSTDGTATMVRLAARRFPLPLRYVLVTTPGKSHALTAGVAVSRGGVLALTDDDVIVGDEWVTAVRALWREADIGLAGGRVLPSWERAAPRWLRVQSKVGFGELAAPLALLDYGPARMPLGTRAVLGANMAVDRRALDQVGGFALDLGKLRGTLLSGEDHQLCERVQAAGYGAVYDPRLVVHHHVPADRLRLGYHLRWFFWSGITNAALDTERFEEGRAGRPVGARHWVNRIARGGGRAFRAAVLARPATCAEAMMDVAFSLGYLACSRGLLRRGVAVKQGRRPRLEAA